LKLEWGEGKKVKMKKTAGRQNIGSEWEREAKPGSITTRKGKREESTDQRIREEAPNLERGRIGYKK